MSTKPENALIVDPVTVQDVKDIAGEVAKKIAKVVIENKFISIPEKFDGENEHQAASDEDVAIIKSLDGVLGVKVGNDILFQTYQRVDDSDEDNPNYIHIFGTFNGDLDSCKELYIELFKDEGNFYYTTKVVEV